MNYPSFLAKTEEAMRRQNKRAHFLYRKNPMQFHDYWGFFFRAKMSPKEAAEHLAKMYEDTPEWGEQFNRKPPTE